MVSRPPAPSSLDALVAAQQAQLRALRDILGEMQYMRREITALRRITAGPFRVRIFTPASQAITVPYSIQSGGSVNLIPKQQGPGGLTFASLTLSAIGDASTGIIISPQYDGQVTDLSVTSLVQGQSSGMALGIDVVQANVQNGLVTLVLSETGNGFAFYRDFALSLRNTFSSAISVLSFLAVGVFRAETSDWDEITQPEETHAPAGSPLYRAANNLTGS